MIASLHDEDNHITIPGFYDKVKNFSADERAEMAKAPFDGKEINAHCNKRYFWRKRIHNQRAKLSDQL
jgi:hypothetical protein